MNKLCRFRDLPVGKVFKLFGWYHEFGCLKKTSKTLAKAIRTNPNGHLTIKPNRADVVRVIQ